jgi:DNA-binding response OmpR family regulator
MADSRSEDGLAAEHARDRRRPDSMHRLLIVDDEDPILVALEDFFRGLGYEVDGAAEREEAEALLTKYEYSLVLADPGLTGVDGAGGSTLMRDVRLRSPRTRVILFTVPGAPDIKAEARRLGVDALVAKPTPLPELERIVKSLLEPAA